MNMRVDQFRLSQYLDGEMNPDQMDIEEENIQNNRDAQTYVLKNAIATARLKQSMKSELFDSISTAKENLGEQFVKQGRLNGNRYLLYQIAASIIILFIGTGIGLFYTKNIMGTNPPGLMASIPEAYRSVINHALEFEKSGTSYNGFVQQKQLVVTPVRTFKNKKGQFFREYQLQINLNGNSEQVKCMAFRSGHREWSTIALFFRDDHIPTTI